MLYPAELRAPGLCYSSGHVRGTSRGTGSGAWCEGGCGLADRDARPVGCGARADAGRWACGGSGGDRRARAGGGWRRARAGRSAGRVARPAWPHPRVSCGDRTVPGCRRRWWRRAWPSSHRPPMWRRTPWRSCCGWSGRPVRPGAGIGRTAGWARCRPRAWRPSRVPSSWCAARCARSRGDTSSPISISVRTGGATSPSAPRPGASRASCATGLTSRPCRANGSWCAGWLFWHAGPMIELVHPRQIEVEE